MNATWLGVWSRAVLGPAAKRTAAVWAGAGTLAAVMFGPTGVQPGDITGLALHSPAAGAVLAITWLLVFLPIARAIVRAEPARYLLSLPGPRGAAAALSALALFGFQLPWLVLWLVGAGPLGAAVVAGETVVLVLFSLVRAPPMSRRIPAWRSGLAALCGMHARALSRRAGDALVRGTGLAILAGAAAGLLIRNNAVTGASAAVLGTCVIAVMLVPAHAGVLLVVLDAHRSSTWLAGSLGISRSTRIAAVAAQIAIVHLVATLLALGATEIVVGADAGTFAALAGVALACALGTAMAEARAVVAAEHRADAAQRIVTGAILAAAIVVLALGTIGAAGTLAVVVIGAVLLGRVSES